MAKEMVYFNSIKQVDTVTFHYNEKLDGEFVKDVVDYIKEISKRNRVNLKSPREFDTIQVFVYPSIKMFNQIFGGEIERRYYNRKRSAEDFYIVKDAEGNIHIASPRGKNQEKRQTLKLLLATNILTEYVDEKDKVRMKNTVRETFKRKQKELELQEKQDDEEKALEEGADELEQDGEVLEEETEKQEENGEALEEEENDEITVEEILAVENEMEQIEDKELNKEQDEKETKAVKQDKNGEARYWLDIGWLAYVSGKLKKEKEIEAFSERISKKGVTKLTSLKKGKIMDNYNFSEEYAAAIVEYIIEIYGKKKFLEFYENPKDIKGVFGVTKLNFNNNVKAYIYSKYGPQRMLMEMDKKRAVKGNEKFTVLEFSKDGGVDIEIEETEAPQKVK